MKTTSILRSVLFATSILVLLTNCSGNKKVETAGNQAQSKSESSNDSAKPQFQVDAKFQEQLAIVFTAYVQLKDAFVASDASKVKAAAATTRESITKVDMTLLTGAAHNDWMHYLVQIEVSLKDIVASSDISTQRKSFSTLSDNLYKSIKAFGLGGKEAFYDFCPMAFDNEGGYWLSDQDQIRNPYFGDEMLTCGQVKEKLK